MTIRICVPAVTLAAATVLAACSGGGGGGNTARTPTPAPPASTSFDRNQAVAYGANQPASVRSIGSFEPTTTDPSGSVAFVGGANPLPMLRDQERRAGCTQQSCYPRSLHTVHDGVEVGHVRFRDGVSAAELLRYLRADASDSDGVIERWSSPPSVRMVAGSTSQDVTDTFQAVRLINSALPTDWQLRFDTTPAERDGQLTQGVIEVGFAPREDWPTTCGGSKSVIGCAWTQRTSNSRMTGAAIAVDPIRVTGERRRIAVLLHELLHALGRGHVNPNVIPNTIMHPSGDLGESGHLILSNLDVAALYAVYDRLSAGQSDSDLDHNSLGPWSDVSTHVAGRIGYIPGRFEAVLFGAVWQNGNVRPWAMAWNPSALPQRLSGSASWAGRLLGMTPQAETVAGAADMTVQLHTLRGTLDFTGLEKWAAHAGPGALGTGTQWGDGDLNYRIAANGPVFYETGGDAGKVTGVFFGAGQQRMGGTLRRTDLAAGFGAQRR